ncbi:MAG: glycoside hydrolase family 31 protein [Anaerolineae bacterium]|nr:glycoside hydrolase family 31 protein [Anaerolineae bacterium]
MNFQAFDHGLYGAQRGEHLWVEPYGPDALRVRAGLLPQALDLPGALLPAQPASFQVDLRAHGTRITNGQIACEVDLDGRLRFLNTSNDEIILEEVETRIIRPHGRNYRSRGGGLFELDVRFLTQPGERFYGLGQHQHGLLDQKGCVIDLAQQNTEVSIPLLLSNRGYGFFWNHPGLGRVELGFNGTRWVADAARQIDYVVMAAPTLPGILDRYTTITGRPTRLPDWAAGFWQSKLRYRSQQEVLDVIAEYRRRGLPLSTVVIDFFHWTHMGDWQFNPADWPDPAEMVRQAREAGVELVVSVWPTVNESSHNFATLCDQGMLVQTEQGTSAPVVFEDVEPPGPVHLHLIDSTNPQARAFLWEQVRQGYYHHGIRSFWLDACEPEIYPPHHDNLRYSLGNGAEVGCLYPMLHQQAFYDGLSGEGEKEILSLCRSAWAGSQRLGVSVWSGDIHSTFEDLARQIPAGLNIGMSGIPYWGSDIGGFTGGQIDDPAFHELLVRWFQFAVFTPVFRLHGYREPGGGHRQSGAANELWSFGEEVYPILEKFLHLRYRLLPYILQMAQEAQHSGAPMMRPLFWHFPRDARCWEIADQFLFGPNLLVAPVIQPGSTERRVYLPASCDWVDVWDKKVYTGGQEITIPTPLEMIPVFVRQGYEALFS